MEHGLSDFQTLILGVGICLCWLPSKANSHLTVSLALCEISSCQKNVWTKKGKGKGQGERSHNIFFKKCPWWEQHIIQAVFSQTCLVKDWRRRWFFVDSLKARACGWEGDVMWKSEVGVGLFEGGWGRCDQCLWDVGSEVGKSLSGYLMW